MVKDPTDSRVECLNRTRTGRICGAHLTEGMTFCPVCGEKTTTRPLDTAPEVAAEPRARRDGTAPR
jgi:uncharacterized Zn finger protein (UPF0148 family)